MLVIAPAAGAAQLTSSSVFCQPSAVGLAQATTCVATVNGSAPSGAVTFSAVGGTFGAGGACALTPTGASESSCSTTYARGDAADTAITASYGGDGANEPSSATTTLTVRELEIVSTTLDRRKGTGELEARAPGPGSVKLFGESLRGSRSHVGGAGPVTFPVTAKGTAKRKLRRKGKARVAPTVTFSPGPGGQLEVVVAKLKLVKKR